MQILLLHQQILLQTERLRDMHRSIMTHSSPVPAAEIENLLQEIRNLYSLTLQLNNENALQLLNEVQLAVKQSIPPVSKSALQESPVKPVSEIVIQEEIKNIPAQEKIQESKNPVIAKAEENTAEKKRIVSDIHEMFHDAPTFADKFSDQPTLADKIAGSDNKKRVSDNLKVPVKDIKSAIGLNEKFQFINQLFNGDSKKYNAVIDQLNASSSADVAMNYVKEISDNNNWESHAASARTFIEIIERRFSA